MRPVPNLTLRREDGRVVAESVTVADSTGRRLRGLLGKRDLPSGHGVLLRPAWSIHTAFMRFPIDVVFLDADQIVVKIVPSLPPVQDGLLPRRARGRGAPRGRVRAARARARRSGRLGGAGGRRGGARVAVADLEGERRGAVVLGSSDQRYLKLVRFLLDGKGIGVVASVAPAASVAEAAGGESADVVLIDAGGVTEGLRLANVTRARRPEATVVLVGENAGDRAPAGMRIYEKWDDTEGVVAAIADAIEQRPCSLGGACRSRGRSAERGRSTRPAEAGLDPADTRAGRRGRA